MIHYGLTDREAMSRLNAYMALARAFEHVRPTAQLMDALYQALARHCV